MTKTEIAPCPFCGEKAELSSGRFDGKDTSYVMCTRCGSRGEFFFVDPEYASAEKAIEAWNRRTDCGRVKNDYSEWLQPEPAVPLTSCIRHTRQKAWNRRAKDEHTN